MSPRRGPGLEQRRRQAHADEVMLAVAARLLGEARLVGAFPTETGALAQFAARIGAELGDDEHLLAGGEGSPDLPRSDYKVVIEDTRPDAVHLSCHYDHRSEFGTLRIDGVLEAQGGSLGAGVDDPAQREELSPLEREVMRRALAREREAGGLGSARFRGEEFVRAVAVPPQPGAAAQILAVELFGDGLVVLATYDDPVPVRPAIPLEYYDLAEVEPTLEALLAEAEAEGGNLEPNISVADELGTRYRHAGGDWAGAAVLHGGINFVPAVPAAASRLLVSSYAGTVEVVL